MNTIPETLTVTFELKESFAMERIHIKKQRFIKIRLVRASTIAEAKQLHGKELSYNNINDADAALANC